MFFVHLLQIRIAQNLFIFIPKVFPTIISTQLTNICRYKSIELGYKLDFQRTHSDFNAFFFITKCTLRHKQKPKVVFIQNILSPSLLP